MQLRLESGLADSYTSRSQRARILSERWVRDNLYCPACRSDRLFEFPNNQRAADFRCDVCSQQYELKSGTRLGPKIVNGAYSTLIERLEAADNPNLVLLRFDAVQMRVLSVDVIPRQFFVPSMVEPRPPLSATARRAGWVGCTIRLDRIPKAGRISVINDRMIRSADEVRTEWSRTSFLNTQGSIKQRSWMMAVMAVVERFGSEEFRLSDVYRHENDLRQLFPANQNIRAKLRQQLQYLRDEQVLSFLGNGRYRLAEAFRVKPSNNALC